jgi:CubicO group peptidase (beta-lactamase class C family)
MLFAPAKRALVEAAVDGFMASSATPGLAVAVVESGRLTWARGFGKADLEDGAPASEHTLFRLGAISKSLTATAAMRLAERGQLDLDAPVQKYCPSFPQKPWPITTRQLLGHLGGIRGDESGTPGEPERRNTAHFGEPIAAGLLTFASDALVAAPGTQFHYSTRGYTLVGCALEGAGGRPYADLMREVVLGAAGMTQTVIDDRLAIVPERARAYERVAPGEAAIRNADFFDSSDELPGAGWLSSAEDMARFVVAVLGDHLMRRSSRDVMWAPSKPSDGSEASYGLGWQVGPSTFGHAAAQPGASAAFVVAPRRGAGVVVLTNLGGAHTGKLAAQILGVVLGER